MEKKFTLFFTHSQLAVFNSEITDPFNSWEEEHVQQGFSWRKGAVSFGTIIDSGDIDIKVQTSKEFKHLTSSELIIRVPFNVSKKQNIEVASISESKTVQISEGMYSLFYESYRLDHGAIFCKLTFVVDDNAEPDVLKGLDWMKPKYPLLMETQPS